MSNTLTNRDHVDDEDESAAAFAAIFETAAREDAAARAAATRYYEAGFNVIPLISETKKAVDKYRALHGRRQTRAELDRWGSFYKNGIAIVTGAVSGVVCIDCDGPVGEEVLREWERINGSLPLTWTVRSGSKRGVHRYFRHPGHGVATKTNLSIKLDIKGDGGIAVAPPTLHESGGRYAVEIDAPIAALPHGLLIFIEQKAAGTKGQACGLARIGGSANHVLPGNISSKPPLNAWNVKVVRSMLRSLPDWYADDYDTWLQIGFAVHWFDDRATGLALWREFSERHPLKAGQTNFAEKWSSFAEPIEGPRIAIWTLRKMALEFGWPSKPWDWREVS